MALARILLVLVGAVLLSGCSDEAGDVANRANPSVAAQSLANAIDQRDADAVRSAFVSQTPAQKDYVEAMAELLTASRALTQEGRRRFGRDDAEVLLGHGNPGTNEMRLFSEATPVVTGDLATITTRTGDTLTLRKAQDQWKVVPAATGDAAASDEEGLTYATQKMRRLAKALNQTAEELKAGQYKSAEEARKAVIERGFEGASGGMTKGE